jgi:hypothetical protein
LDKTAPIISLTSPSSGGSYVLNSLVASNYDCSDATSGLAGPCTAPVVSGANFSTTPIGAHGFTVNAVDLAGNTASATNNYNVIFAAGGTCFGSPGHEILQPIDSAGSSVFKKNSTAPAKFRVCDANGVSIGPSTVVSSFVLHQTLNGTFSYPNETVDSTTPDTAFRWSPSDQQWIFNVSTKTLPAGLTYVYRIYLIDGSYIEFRFGLR